MAVTYTWSVAPNGLQTKTIEGVADIVTVVRVTIGATDGVNSVSLTRGVPIPLKDINGIVPFAQLTETQIINWVREKLGEMRISNIEKVLAKQLEVKANPSEAPVFKNGPWVV